MQNTWFQKLMSEATVIYPQKVHLFYYPALEWFPLTPFWELKPWSLCVYEIKLAFLFVQSHAFESLYFKMVFKPYKIPYNQNQHKSIICVEFGVEQRPSLMHDSTFTTRGEQRFVFGLEALVALPPTQSVTFLRGEICTTRKGSCS